MRVGQSIFCDEDRKRLSDLGDRLWKPEMMAKSLLLDGVFPSEQEYDASDWANWRNRIQEGERIEQEIGSKRVDELVQSKQVAVDSDEYSSAVTDGLCRPLGVSNAMCAALIVAIWANIDLKLQQLLATAFIALGETCKIPFSFKDIKEQYEKKLSIDLETLNHYSEINAARILNNCFKHDNGGYDDKTAEPWNRIDPLLLTRWEMTVWQAIDFTNLPIREITVASRDFFEELYENVDASVRQKLAGHQ